FGMLGASGAVAVLSFFAVSAVLQGHGPFRGHPAHDTGIAMQYFLLLRAVPFYLIAVLIQQKQTVEAVLRENESAFRSMADSAPVLIWISSADRLGEFFNRGWLDFTGRSLNQERGTGWMQGVHEEDQSRFVDDSQRACDARQPFEMEYRLRRHDGE